MSRYHETVTNDDVQSMTVRFPEAVHERLRREAFDRRVSMSSIIVEAVRKELSMERRPE
jgi:predicted HicB family RNase H-like nuclease